MGNCLISKCWFFTCRIRFLSFIARLVLPRLICNAALIHFQSIFDHFVCRQGSLIFYMASISFEYCGTKIE